MSTTDRRTAFFAAYDHAADIVAGVQPSQLDRPTACPEYDLQALVDHLVGAAHRAAALGRGEQPTDHEFPHVDLADAAGELRQAGKDARAAWSADASLDMKVQMPWGEVYDGTTLLDMYLAELTGHTWDVAQASGQLDRLDRALGATALDGAKAMLKPEYRDLVAPGSPFGPEVTPPEGATEWERLAAFMGRQPRPALA